MVNRDNFRAQLLGPNKYSVETYNSIVYQTAPLVGS